MSTCAAAIPLADLLDWWLDDVESARADEIEEHFFGCDDCTDRLERLRELGAGVVTVTREGALPLSGTTAILNRLARDHRRVRHYTARPGQTVHCSSTHEDDWLMSRLVADVDGIERVDLTVENEQGTQIAQVDDLAVDRAAGEVLVLYPAVMGRDPGGMFLRIRLRDGERVLGEYVFEHTPPDPL